MPGLSVKVGGTGFHSSLVLPFAICPHLLLALNHCLQVFRTFNASITLDRLLNEDAEETAKEVLVDKKIAHYNTANKEVAILCNHQRSIPKTHDDSMKRMQEKMEKANVRRQ